MRRELPVHPLITGLTAALDYWQRGEPVALATVVEVIGSRSGGNRGERARRCGGAIAAGITAGCVESHIVTAAAQVLRDQVPVCKEFDYDADAPLQPVPACGGRLRVLLEPVDTRSWPDLPATVDLLRTGDAAALVVGYSGSGACGAAPGRDADGIGRGCRPRNGPGRRSRGCGTGWRWRRSDSGSAAGVGIQGVPLAKAIMVPPRWRLLIVGAVEYGRMLSPLAQSMGFDVTVCDARPAFLTPERFPGATLVRAQPGAWLAEHAEQELTDRTAVCVLSHDPASMYRRPLRPCAARRRTWGTGFAGHTRTGSAACVRSASAMSNWPGCARRSDWTCRRRRRRDRFGDPRGGDGGSRRRFRASADAAGRPGSTSVRADPRDQSVLMLQVPGSAVVPAKDWSLERTVTWAYLSRWSKMWERSLTIVVMR